MNDDEYDNGYLNQNEEVCDFVTSYFIAEPVFDEMMMEKITTKLKTNKTMNDEKWSR